MTTQEDAFTKQQQGVSSNIQGIDTQLLAALLQADSGKATALTLGQGAYVDRNNIIRLQLIDR